MPSREVLERFLDGMYSDRGEKTVWYDNEIGKFIE